MTDVVGWFLEGQKSAMYQGWSDFLRLFVVFLNSPHRETFKNVTKQIEEKTVLVLDLVFDFFETISTRLFGKTFFVVFLNSHR
jgi:hypothetical protein